MKVKELVEFVSNQKNKILKAEQLQRLLVKILEVKDYLGIKQKKELIDDIINECVLYEDGVFKFDDIDKYICFTMKTIAAYTNLELSDDMEEDYDSLCKAKLLDVIISAFKKEYDDVSVLLQMKCEYILSGNNLEAQIGKFLNSLLEKIDDFANILNNQFGDFDISKLPIGKDELTKLLEFVESQEK